MKSYILKFSLIVLTPFLLSLQMLLMYRGHFLTIAEEFSNTAAYTEKATKLQSGELVLSQNEIANLYLKFAKTDVGISTGARLMASSTMFYLFAWGVILSFQTIMLIKAYSIIKASNATKQSNT